MSHLSAGGKRDQRVFFQPLRINKQRSGVQLRGLFTEACNYRLMLALAGRAMSGSPTPGKIPPHVSADPSATLQAAGVVRALECLRNGRASAHAANRITTSALINDCRIPNEVASPGREAVTSTLCWHVSVTTSGCTPRQSHGRTSDPSIPEIRKFGLLSAEGKRRARGGRQPHLLSTLRLATSPQMPASIEKSKLVTFERARAGDQ